MSIKTITSTGSAKISTARFVHHTRLGNYVKYDFQTKYERAAEWVDVADEVLTACQNGTHPASATRLGQAEDQYEKAKFDLAQIEKTWVELYKTAVVNTIEQYKEDNY